MKNWKKISERTIYEGWRGVIQKRYELPNGKLFDFDIIQNGSYVTVAAITERKEVVLMRQFRPGAERVLLSFCEGYIDEGESPAQAAARELLEETGYQANEMIFLREVHAAYTTGIRYCFLAKDCIKVAEQQLEESEVIDFYTMPLKEFRSYIKNPKLSDFTNTATAYLALDHLNVL